MEVIVPVLVFIALFGVLSLACVLFEAWASRSRAMQRWMESLPAFWR